MLAEKKKPCECCCVTGLDLLTGGSVAGGYKISEYYPGLPITWGDDTQLGVQWLPMFKVAFKWQALGYWYSQVNYEDIKGDCTLLQEVHDKDNPAWQNDDEGAGGTDPNAEVGVYGPSGLLGRRRTIMYPSPVSDGIYSWVDPSLRTAIIADWWEFRVTFASAKGCPCTPPLSITKHLKIGIVRKKGRLQVVHKVY